MYLEVHDILVHLGVGIPLGFLKGSQLPSLPRQLPFPAHQLPFQLGHSALQAPLLPSQALQTMATCMTSIDLAHAWCLGLSVLALSGLPTAVSHKPRGTWGRCLVFTRCGCCVCMGACCGPALACMCEALQICTNANKPCNACHRVSGQSLSRCCPSSLKQVILHGH